MYKSSIAALVCISESEIAEVYKDYDSTWDKEQPDKLKGILYEAGLDTNTHYEKQEDILHRNIMNKVVKCHRWVGNSRTDKAWINSGYASAEAIDRSKCNRLLDDLYRSKGLTMDRQAGVFQPEEFEQPDVKIETKLDEDTTESLWDLQVKMSFNNQNKEQDA